jgi:tripeptidyl-peptidase-1
LKAYTDREGKSWVRQNTHPTLRSINGAYGPTNDITRAGDEADLDFQVAIPLIWPQHSVLFQTDDEWYQQDQSRAGTRYPGFFNSKSPSLPFLSP